MTAVGTLFLDLDDTIFPSRIPYAAFSELFDVLDRVNDVLPQEKIDEVKQQLYRQTFGEVAEKYAFSPRMVRAYFEKMKTMRFNFNITVYDDYTFLQQLPQDKYLVTSGSRYIQMAKIVALGIQSDFTEIHIDDPYDGSPGKAGIFTKLVKQKKLSTREILIIGDNPNSEIKAAKQLEIPHLLIDRNSSVSIDSEGRKVNSFRHIHRFL